ncbi:PfkB family carbohydrate kinase, partial [Salmonella enterica]|nr:PfkB family carbohydrate kinase [Salmonella enterica]
THFYAEGYLVQNPQLIETAFQVAHEKGLTTILDLASYNTVEENLEFMQKLIRRHVDVVFANEEEATAFTGKEDDEALNEIGELADIVVLKQGRRGSLVKVGHDRARCGVIESNAIDTTGAGDLYAAGFLWALIGGLDPLKCATAGAVLSGNVIEVIGAKMDANRWTSIRQELKKLC